MGECDECALVCTLLWKLSRFHGWSGEVSVADLVRRASVRDEARGRDVARTILPRRAYVGYHPGSDTIWLRAPLSEALYYDLRDECGYLELQIEATFDSYFDGFG